MRFPCVCDCLAMTDWTLTFSTKRLGVASCVSFRFESVHPMWPMRLLLTRADPQKSKPAWWRRRLCLALHREKWWFCHFDIIYSLHSTGLLRMLHEWSECCQSVSKNTRRHIVQLTHNETEWVSEWEHTEQINRDAVQNWWDVDWGVSQRRPIAMLRMAFREPRKSLPSVSRSIFIRRHFFFLFDSFRSAHLTFLPTSRKQCCWRRSLSQNYNKSPHLWRSSTIISSLNYTAITFLINTQILTQSRCRSNNRLSRRETKFKWTSQTRWQRFSSIDNAQCALSLRQQCCDALFLVNNRLLTNNYLKTNSRML